MNVLGVVPPSAIVSADHVEAEPRTKKEKMTPNQQTIFGMLHAAGTAGLLLENWNQQARDAGMGAKRKADLNDIRAALLSKGLVRQYGDRWAVDHG